MTAEPRRRAELTAAIGSCSQGRYQNTDPVAVAVSGGPDSLALLWLAREAFGDRVEVLTVDHCLRLGSAGDAAHVARCAAELNLPHTTLTWAGPTPTGNLQAAARAARYRLLADWCAARDVRWLLTAHHADDQAETLLLRLARGSGSAGLAGLRRRRNLGSGVTLLRPLLDWRRSELAGIVAAAGWTALDDPANRATRFDRTQARALLAETPWLRPERLAAAAAHLAEAEAALAWTAELAWSSRAAISPSGIMLDAAGLPHELQRRMMLRVIATLAPGADLAGPSLERWRRLLLAGRRATLAGIVGSGRGRKLLEASDSRGAGAPAGQPASWHFAVARPRR